MLYHNARKDIKLLTFNDWKWHSFTDGVDIELTNGCNISKEAKYADSGQKDLSEKIS